jgi:hypothetical protein
MFMLENHLSPEQNQLEMGGSRRQPGRSCAFPTGGAMRGHGGFDSRFDFTIEGNALLVKHLEHKNGATILEVQEDRRGASSSSQWRARAGGLGRAIDLRSRGKPQIKPADPRGFARRDF